MEVRGRSIPLAKLDSLIAEWGGTNVSKGGFRLPSLDSPSYPLMPFTAAQSDRALHLSKKAGKYAYTLFLLCDAYGFLVLAFI